MEPEKPDREIEYFRLVRRFKRTHPECQRCGQRPTQDVHHTRGRSGTLLLDWRHWRAVCRECHAWIGDNPERSRREGFLCAKGLWNVPDETPKPTRPW